MPGRAGVRRSRASGGAAGSLVFRGHDAGVAVIAAFFESMDVS